MKKLLFRILTIACIVVLLGRPEAALSLPDLDVLTKGKANISSPNASNRAITATDKAVTDPSYSNVMEAESVIVTLPSVDNKVLIRGLGHGRKDILGNVSYNTVFIPVYERGIYNDPNTNIDIGSTNEPVTGEIEGFESKLIEEQIRNIGTLDAEGGIDLINAESLDGTFAEAINLGGMARGTKLVYIDGVIRIVAEEEDAMEEEEHETTTEDEYTDIRRVIKALNAALVLSDFLSDLVIYLWEHILRVSRDEKASV